MEAATRCKSLVVFKQGVCIFHHGMANEEADPAKSSLGPICQKAMDDEKGNYLANLVLYPGKPPVNSASLAYPCIKLVGTSVSSDW